MVDYTWPVQDQLKDKKVLARAISMVENEAKGSIEWLANLSFNNSIPVIGITGPPGAGKSTLVNALIGQFLNDNLKIAVLLVDPASKIHGGAILGDRIRMPDFYDNPNVYIRSISTRGIYGGLSARTYEISDVLNAAGFDLIIIETVGIGQSEVEIASLADLTVLVLVPESGDSVQVMKAGILEVADIYVVNKSDHPGAEELLTELRRAMKETGQSKQVVKTIATTADGITELKTIIQALISSRDDENQRASILAERVFQIIQHHRMSGIDTKTLTNEIESLRASEAGFNIYNFAGKYLK